jgi:hypothetical protein
VTESSSREVIVGNLNDIFQLHRCPFALRRPSARAARCVRKRRKSPVYAPLIPENQRHVASFPRFRKQGKFEPYKGMFGWS